MKAAARSNWPVKIEQARRPLPPHTPPGVDTPGPTLEDPCARLRAHKASAHRGRQLRKIGETKGGPDSRGQARLGPGRGPGRAGATGRPAGLGEGTSQ